MSPLFLFFFSFFHNVNVTTSRNDETIRSDYITTRTLTFTRTRDFRNRILKMGPLRRVSLYRTKNVMIVLANISGVIER